MTAPTQTPDPGAGDPVAPVPDVPVPDVPVLDVTGVGYCVVMSAAWLVAFLVLLTVQEQLEAAGRGWWPWTCLVGLGLGLVAVGYSRRRARGLQQEHVAQPLRPG